MEPASPTTVLTLANEQDPGGRRFPRAFVVTARKGMLVREGIELDTPAVRTIPCGARCVAIDVTQQRSGSERVKLGSPTVGWASLKCLMELSEIPAWEQVLVETGRCRWAVDMASWEPVGGSPGGEFLFLLDLINEPAERSSVLAFLRWEDQRRALVARLLARRVCVLGVGLGHEDVVITRTKGRKPFLSHAALDKADAGARATAPNFNFNVSHEGIFVVLASEPLCVCGIDVAAPEQFRLGDKRSLDDFFTTMRDVLTVAEWRFVREERTDDRRALRFRCLWSCKEAYTKARGDGLAFKFSRCHFDVDFLQTVPRLLFEARVAVDGLRLPQWRFCGEEIHDGHVITVARGPPGDIVDAVGTFKRTLSRHLLEDAAFAEPHPEFSLLTVRDLVPPEKLEKYEAVLAQNTR